MIEVRVSEGFSEARSLEGETQLGELARLAAFDDEVGTGGKLPEAGAARLGPQVDRCPLLVAAEIGEERTGAVHGGGWRQTPQRMARRWLADEHVGPEVGEQAGAVRPRDVRAYVKDAEALQRERRHGYAFPQGQADLGLAGHGDLAALVLTPDVERGERLPVDGLLAGDLALAPGRVAEEVELGELHLDGAHESVVAAPVGEGVDDPAEALRPDVVGRGRADLAGQGAVPVGAHGEVGGVGGAVGDVGLGVFLYVALGDLGGEQERAAPARVEGHHLALRQGPFHDVGNLVADVHVLEVAGFSALPLLAGDVGVEVGQGLFSPHVLLKRLELAALP